MFIRTIPVGVFRCNCTVLACEATRKAIVVDPGDEAERILDVIHQSGLDVELVIHTHAHIDHIMGTLGVVEATGAAARLHEADRRLWQQVGWAAVKYRIPVPKTPPLANALEDGETIAFGHERAWVIHTPGHTPGSCCFALDVGDGRKLLLSGDTLLRGKIGVADPTKRSNAVAIVASIRDRLLTLGDDTRVVPGHGPETCIGIERRDNAFLSGT